MSNITLSPRTHVDDHGTDTPEWKKIDTIAYDLETYYLWVILILGFPGNVSTIITIIKMSPARSLTVYIALLAIVDNMAIVNKILIFVLMDYRVKIGSFGCKLLGFCGNFLIVLANWLLVAMSVERFVAVWFPFKIGQSWTFRKTLTVIGGLTVPLFALFLHLFWTTDYVAVEYPGSSFCGTVDKYVDFMIGIWYWVNVAVYAFIPCTLLLTFNILIVIGISKSKKLHQYLNRNNSLHHGMITTDRQRQITVMLVTSALALVILTIPRCAFLIMSRYWNVPGDTMKGATFYLLDTIAYVLCDSTHAINFYLYSFSARRFRRQFRDLLCCRKRKKRPACSYYIAISSGQSVRFNTLIRDSREMPSVRYRSEEH